RRAALAITKLKVFLFIAHKADVRKREPLREQVDTRAFRAVFWELPNFIDSPREAQVPRNLETRVAEMQEMRFKSSFVRRSFVKAGRLAGDARIHTIVAHSASSVSGTYIFSIAFATSLTSRCFSHPSVAVFQIAARVSGVRSHATTSAKAF